MLPFSQSDVVKSCLKAAVSELYPNKPDISQAVDTVPLSRNSCTRRIEEIADQIHMDLLAELNSSECFSIAIDKSTDVKDMAQLTVFVRFFDGHQFREELLLLVKLDGKTTGEEVYKALKNAFIAISVPLTKLVSISTDGAPAMIGREHGVVQRIRENHNSDLISFHCIIHQTVLCGKLSARFNELMQRMTKLINFLKAKSALRHRQLRNFLCELEAPYADLLILNNVRWLSKGNAISRIWALRDELTLFLETIQNDTAKEFLQMMRSVEDMRDLAFLVDILGHMNSFNLQLQGKGRIVTSLWAAVKSFKLQLEVFQDDLDQNFIHFPTLKDFLLESDTDSSNHIQSLFSGYERRVLSEISAIPSLGQNTDLDQASARNLTQWSLERASKIRFTECRYRHSAVGNVHPAWQ